MSKDAKYLKEEREANYFACALLMPKNLFIAELEKAQKQFRYEDDMLKYLAKTFQVPLFAVGLRLQMIAQ